MRMNFALPLRKYCRGENKELITLRLPEKLDSGLNEVAQSYGWAQTDVLFTAIDQFLQSANADIKAAKELEKELFKKRKDHRIVISLRLHKPLHNEVRSLAKKLKWNATDVILFAASRFIQWAEGHKP